MADAYVRVGSLPLPVFPGRASTKWCVIAIRPRSKRCWVHSFHQSEEAAKRMASTWERKVAKEVKHIRDLSFSVHEIFRAIPDRPRKPDAPPRKRIKVKRA